MKKLIGIFLLLCLCAVTHAQTLAPVTWTAYGLTFDVPQDMLVEEDTEDTYLLNNEQFYISLQSLDSDDMTKDDLKDLLKGLADDDEIQRQSKITALDLSQFHGAYLKGMAENEPCCYACLMTKDAGSVYYISIIYQKSVEPLADKMLKSFKMEEEMAE